MEFERRLTPALRGRYRVEGELGAGGMAAMYLAHDEHWLLYRIGSAAGCGIHEMRSGVESAPGVSRAAGDFDEYAPALSSEGTALGSARRPGGRHAAMA